MSDMEVMYELGRDTITTNVYTDKNGIKRCRYSGHLYNNEGEDFTIDEYITYKKSKGINLALYKYKDAIKLIEKVEDEKYIKDWKEILESEYIRALEILPPENMQKLNKVTIFRFCEYMTRNITAHYASYKGRYYMAYRRTSCKYEDIAKEIIFKYNQKN